MSPGNNESAGKRRSGRTTHGDRWLWDTLIESAWAASKTKGSYFKSRYHRLAMRRGKKRAEVAVGHTILVSVYHILKFGLEYRELGEDYFDKLNEAATTSRLIKHLEKLGHKVTLESLNKAA